MAKHGVKLDTLRDCFEFLHWLNSRKDVQKQVARELVTRYGNSYNHISFTGQLPPAVSEFLGYVSTFYKKLVATPIKESYVDPQAKDVTEALLDCIPKFLAALYFLLYNVDYKFEAVGGAKWRDDNPGWETTWSRYFWQQEYGGGLQDYLRVSLSDKYGGLIPGGFSYGEVTYGYEYDSRYGYPYGKDMTTDLEKMLGKNTDHNYFRDVFFTTVISKSGLQKSNTANVLALVKTFCQIVIAEKNPDGGSLKAALEKELKSSKKCIDWNQLKSHCKTLEHQLGKLFKIEGFSYTGQARSVNELNTERFAGETAKWFRNNLSEVQKNVEQINKDFPVDDTLYLTALRPFATKNIFPYGFIFGNQGYGTMGYAWKKLSDHWDSVIDMLGSDGDGLDKLKTLLDGEQCPPPQKPRSRPAPAPRPTRPARPALPGMPRTSGVRTTGAMSVGGRSYVGSKASGARGGTARGMGPHHRGGGQVRGRAPGAPRGSVQGPGNRGAPGARGTQGSRSPGPTVLIQRRASQSQNDPQHHSQQPPLASSAPGGAVLPASVGPPGGTTPISPAGDVTPGMSVHSVSASGPTGAPGPTGPHGDKGDQGKPGPPGTGTTVSPQDAISPATTSVSTPSQGSVASPVPPPHPGGPSIPGNPGAKDQDPGSHGSVAHGQQPTATTARVPPQSPDVSDSRSGSTGGQGVGTQGSQHGAQPTSQGTDPTPSGVDTTSVVQASGGAGEGGGNAFTCPTAKVEVDGLNGNKICLSKEALRRASIFKDMWENRYKEMQKEDEEKRKQEAEEERKKQEEEDERRRQDAIKARHPIVPGSHSNYHVRNPYHRFPYNRWSSSPSGDQGGATLDGFPQHDASAAIQGVNKMIFEEQDLWDRHYLQQEQGKIELQRRAHREREDFLRSSAARLAAAGSAKRHQAQQTDDDNINRRVQNVTRTRVPPKPLSSVTLEDGVTSALSSMTHITDKVISHRSQHPPATQLPKPTLSGQRPDSPRKQLETVTLGDHDMANVTNITFSDVKTPADPNAYYYGGLTGNSVKDGSNVIRRKTFVADSLDASKQLFEERQRRRLAVDDQIKQSTQEEKDASKAWKDAQQIGLVEFVQQGIFDGQEVKQPEQQTDPRLYQHFMSPTPPFDFQIDTAVHHYNNSQPPNPGSTMDPQGIDIDEQVIQPTERYDHEANHTSDMLSVANDSQVPKLVGGPVDPAPLDIRDENTRHIDFDGVAIPRNQRDKLYLKTQTPTIQYTPWKPDYVTRPRSDSPAVKNLIQSDTIFQGQKISQPKLQTVGVRMPPPLTPVEIEAPPGVMINEPICPANYPSATTEKLPPTDASNPPPRTVRDMLCWICDLPYALGHSALKRHIAGLFEGSEIIASSESFTDNDVIGALSDTCGHASSVLAAMEGPKPAAPNKFHYQRYGVPLMHYSDDPYTLLCQLLNYVYATLHQLLFLRTMCGRDTHSGGWRDCQFGRAVKASEAWRCRKDPVDPMQGQDHGCDASPLQGFLTDQSVLPTYWYHRGDICRRSRVRMGFRPDHLRQESKHGFYIYNILTGLSPLGSALSEPHGHCPDWDRLKDDDLNALQDIRGSAPPIANSNHDKDHSNTLSTLLGCGITNAKCPQLMKPITYRAYALYSSSFVHHYLSWAVYLADRLWESLIRLHYDLENLKCHDSNSKALHHCDKALLLLYMHGITPPEGGSQQSLTCSKVIDKLKEVISGEPIASLMTAMDNFLYGIRLPFLYTVFTLWVIATLYITHTTLYRLDVLRIRSHLLTTTASHLIDVKALLSHKRKVLSLYDDVDYFDDDFHS
ncbi:Chitin bind 4 domain containing protein, putative [Babesia ovata]|uniref:Chitin bind 4 domain containing protein, putative n=1 Tax=Babesia ovata TaxID=189622 RepID=A0A2H6K757_9APIC|nr:Chitin bind 4 domain containing protein, putative [Babesia ovata]GBE58836.1 Chitin bind 4 domain containing protein, putative [Babesia ovata]